MTVKSVNKIRELLNEWNRVSARFKALEVRCPSCKLEGGIDEIGECGCGALCCTECLNYYEDAQLCSECNLAFLQDHAHVLERVAKSGVSEEAGGKE